MNKKIILIVLLLATISFAGCASKNNPIEHEIIKVNVVENIDDDLNQYDFDIIYINPEGYIRYMSTSEQDSNNIVRLKRSDDNEYKLLKINDGISIDTFELHIPKNVTLFLQSEEMII
ncbi:MAG: hypothetical protein KAT48_10745 [Bacteroidales bacterium]|nr:hypothetical protein [Bacteroidales bacterium]